MYSTLLLKLVVCVCSLLVSSSSINNIDNKNQNNVNNGLNIEIENELDNMVGVGIGGIGILNGDFGSGFCNLTRGIHSNLIRMITKEGFHRELNDKFEITVTNSPLPVGSDSECVFNVLYKFGVGVYIDPYEPVEAKQARTMIILNNWTDLESPAWLAKSNSTLLVHPKRIMTGNLLTTEEIKIPIHFRYQKPVRAPRRRVRGGSTGLFNTGGYSEVTIPLPRLLIRCNNWHIDPTDHDKRPTTNGLESDKRPTTTSTKDLQQQLPTAGVENCRVVKTLCSPTHSKDEICSWISIPFKSNSKGSTVYIPVGDGDSRGLVTTLTLLVILGGTIFILHSLSRASKEIRNILLLHQQQLFNNKPKVD